MLCLRLPVIFLPSGGKGPPSKCPIRTENEGIPDAETYHQIVRSPCPAVLLPLVTLPLVTLPLPLLLVTLPPVTSLYFGGADSPPHRPDASQTELKRSRTEWKRALHSSQLLP